MPKPRTLIPRNMAHKLLMILVIIYFRNYVDNLIYMRGMLMTDMETFVQKANEQSCIRDANIISESIGEGV